MKCSLAFLLLGLAGSVLAADNTTYPYLYSLQPAYNLLNLTLPANSTLTIAGRLNATSTVDPATNTTKLSFPASINCWLFTTPSLSLVLNGTAYMIESNTDAANVSSAWCTLQGFTSATDYLPTELPTPYNYNSNTINVATGATSPAGTGFRYIECARGNATKLCSAALPQRSGTGNRGYFNDGSNNYGNYNTGSNNYGDYNQGSSNYGSFNVGSNSKGSYNTASNCVGDYCTASNQVVAPPGGGLPNPLL